MSYRTKLIKINVENLFRVLIDHTFSCSGQIRGEHCWRRGESTRLPPMWPGSNPSIDAICGLSFLLVLAFVPGGFFPGTPVFPPQLLFQQIKVTSIAKMSPEHINMEVHDIKTDEVFLQK